jgi:hypothetical protein
MDAFKPSITTWNRLEPRPRSATIGPSLAAEIHDPFWLLARQWQLGEFQGEDAGSLAYVTHQVTSGAFVGWSDGTRSTPLSSGPLEPQLFAEPFPTDDLSLQVEIGQVFLALLDEAGASSARRAFLDLEEFQLSAPPEDQQRPLDPAAQRLLLVCGGRSLNGAAVHTLALDVGRGARAIPSPIASAAPVAAIKRALSELVAWVAQVWGTLGTDDPRAWRPERLEYDATLTASSPANEAVTLRVVPDAEGDCHWSSFDLRASGGAPPIALETLPAESIVPAPVRFTGMPAPRFWDFESGELSLPDLRLDKTDIAKLVVADFMLLHGEDWYVFPLALKLGSLARIDSLVATDVFGVSTPIARADKDSSAPGPGRWTMFTNARLAVGASVAGLADFFLVPPSAGAALEVGPVLEEVRFAIDEMANLVWGIERVTASRAGDPRPGSERDAALDVSLPVAPPASSDTSSPLRYQIESTVPANWAPFVGRLLGTGPAVALERASVLRPQRAEWELVTPAGKILNPQKAPAPYQIAEEEVPRLGLTVQRVVLRTRWTDGRTYLWITRRRRTGTGETQSGLRFDAALPRSI